MSNLKPEVGSPKPLPAVEGRIVIFLLGGTSESVQAAGRLAEAGYRVLVSMATDEPLDMGDHPNIRRRTGRLDEDAMAALAAAEGAKAIVDVTHPYAAAVRATARNVARRLGIAYLTYLRQGQAMSDAVAAHSSRSQNLPLAGQNLRALQACDGLPDTKTHAPADGEEFIYYAADHEQAAKIAFSFGKAVLLTTGANNLAPYAAAAARAATPLVARVLNRTSSLDACRAAGIAPERIIAAKGPFSVADNRLHIRQHDVGVVVTKDSGAAGGFDEKLQAARLENCRVVIVQRPATQDQDACSSIDELVDKVIAMVRP